MTRVRTGLWWQASSALQQSVTAAVAATVAATVDARVARTMQLLRSSLWPCSALFMQLAVWSAAITSLHAQSNLGRGPRRCESKSPLVTMARPKFAPKSTSSRPIPKLHYVLHPWTRSTYDARSDQPFFYNAVDRPTDRRTDRQIVHGKVWWL